MGEYQLIIVMIGGMIGFALSVPAFWGILKWIEHRDMTRVDRMMKKWAKERMKR